jgi:hypothetical protein
LHTIQDGLDQNWSSVCYIAILVLLSSFCFLCWNLVSYRTHVCILELKGEKKTLYIFVVQWILGNGVEGIGKLFFYVTYT